MGTLSIGRLTILPKHLDMLISAWQWSLFPMFVQAIATYVVSIKAIVPKTQ